MSMLFLRYETDNEKIDSIGLIGFLVEGLYVLTRSRCRRLNKLENSISLSMEVIKASILVEVCHNLHSRSHNDGSSHCGMA